MSFEKFWDEFKKDYDVWNMSLERYNELKAEAKEIYDRYVAK